MAGAIVPDDWDGITYKCYRVEWPQSEQYEAILLGSISKPSYLDYWDPETGDAQDAANAIKSAYNQTLPDFWAEDCEAPLLATKSFRVRHTAAQSIPAATWTKVLFNGYQWNKQSPGWNLAENAQDLTLLPSEGVWQYNAGVNVDTATRIRLGVVLNNYRFIVVSELTDGIAAQVNTGWYVDASWTWLNLWIWSEIAVNTVVVPDYTPWFEGHLVTSVEEA